MRSSWRPSPEQLDEYADQHIGYEIRMLIGQFRSLVRHGACDTQDRQALVEAVLVHLRLLDDFLGSPNQCREPRAGKVEPDDVFARHWVRDWQPVAFLGQDRERVNAKVAHLTGRRSAAPDFQPNELAALVRACCIAFSTFFSQLASERVAAFGSYPTQVENFLISG